MISRFTALLALLGLGGAFPAIGQDTARPAAPPQAAPEPTPVILGAVVKPAACPPGKAFKLTLRWSGGPLSHDYIVFTHFVNAQGRTVFQDDHDPDPPTTRWRGAVSDTRNVFVPADAPDGAYHIQAGLYRRTTEAPGYANLALSPGKGATADDPTHFTVGTVTVSRRAPAPPLDSARPATLSLKNYRLTFDEEFSGPLRVSADGPGTRWTAHTPYHGDFGDAGFANPGPDTPFAVSNGTLTITARKVGGHWQTGLLSSVDPHGVGFSQRFGYFEMRARFPKGDGTWPAFWLNDATNLTDRAQTGMEIDVVEQYGLATQAMHSTLHWWRPAGKHDAVATTAFVHDMTDGFHDYGLLWTPQSLTWYFDGVEVYRVPTPPELQTHKEYLLVNLALGGGWPIDKTPDPSRMLVKHVRAYARSEAPPRATKAPRAH